MVFDDARWDFVRLVAPLSDELAPLTVQVIESQVRDDHPDFTITRMLNLLEEARSPVPLDEALQHLRDLGMMRPESERASRTIDVGGRPVELEELSAGRSRELGAWQLLGLTRRCQDWAQRVAGEVVARDLPGVPTFWTCTHAEGKMPVCEPIAPDIGSMTSLDLLTFWSVASEPAATPSTEVLAVLDRSLRLQDQGGGFFDGALRLDQLDDDFVYNFSPQRGAHPTVVATANALSSWVGFANRLDLDDARRDVVERAQVRAAEFVLRSQNPDGSWPIATGAGLEGMAADALAMRFGIYAMSDVCTASSVSDDLRSRCESSLELAAGFLLDHVQDTGVSWSRGLTRGAGAHELQTTALLLSPLQRLSGMVPADLAPGAAAYAWREYRQHPSPVLHADFRVPTWAGVSPEVQTWDLPLDALVLTALFDLPNLAPADAIEAATVARELYAGEEDGHWYDIGGLERGNRRAFPSNSLLNLRALLAWGGASLHRLQTTGQVIEAAGRRS
jgi:hypothetical protein